MLVGVYDGGLTGIDTYAEQVAIAGAAAGNDVTLLTTTPDLADSLRDRLRDTGIRVVSLDLARPTRHEAMAARFWPSAALSRLNGGLTRAGRRLDEVFSVAHLNHPGLSEAARPLATRVCVAAWFYPHDMKGRVLETWRHTGGPGARSLVLVGKSIAHYYNDVRGYRNADCVVAPTKLLADQLLSQGVDAVVCPPPVRGPKDVTPAPDSQELQPVSRASSGVRLLVCCGDLSHPRKNVSAALRSMQLLSRTDRGVTLELIGRNGAALASQVASLPSHVTARFTGPLPAAEVQSRMRAADILLVPSLFEEWGYVAVEALLCGTPVVTFPVYPFADMLSPDFGARAEDMSEHAFADAIERVLDRGRPPDLAAEAQSRFGSQSVGRRLTEVWRSLS